MYQLHQKLKANQRKWVLSDELNELSTLYIWWVLAITEKVDEKLIDIKFVFNGPVTLKSIAKRGYTFQEDLRSLEIYKK